MRHLTTFVFILSFSTSWAQTPEPELPRQTVAAIISMSAFQKTLGPQMDSLKGFYITDITTEADKHIYEYQFTYDLAESRFGSAGLFVVNYKIDMDKPMPSVHQSWGPKLGIVMKDLDHSRRREVQILLEETVKEENIRYPFGGRRLLGLTTYGWKGKLAEDVMYFFDGINQHGRRGVFSVTVTSRHGEELLVSAVRTVETPEELQCRLMFNSANANYQYVAR